MSNTEEDLYELHWNNHAKILKGTFDSFRSDSELVDVTLSCEGKKLKAHKIVLSACSLYFLDLFRDNPCQHPIVILRDVKYQTMVDILSFMYIGEVNVATDHLDIFLQTAELLQVKGLSLELPNIFNSSNKLELNNVQTKNIKSKEPALLEFDTLNEYAQKYGQNLKTNKTLTSDNNNLDVLSSSDKYPEVSKDTEQHQNDDKTFLKDKESNAEVTSLKSLKNKKLSDEFNESISNTLNLPTLYNMKEKAINFFTKKSPKMQVSTNISNDDNENDNEALEAVTLKTECVDIEDLTDSDSIEYLGMDQNIIQNPDLGDPYSLMADYNGSPSTSTTNQSYPCPQCKKVFNHRISLKLHLPRHSGVTRCLICHSVLSRKYDLKVHMRRKHNIDMNEFYMKNYI